MPDVPANPNINPKRYSPFWFRFFEVLPGACAWGALILPFLLSPFYPLPVTIFVILFDVYWLQKSLDIARLLLQGYAKLRRHVHTDWQALLDASLAARKGPDDKDIIDWREIYQAVIYPTYKEEEAILDASIQSVIDADYPADHKILVLATEERAGAEAQVRAENLRRKYADKFFRFIVTVHPDNIVGEVKAKGANASWAAKELVRQMDEAKIPHDRVIVSTGDADCRFIPNYFQALSYFYATTPDRVRCSYQPVATFVNNIWQAPMVSRILAIQTTFWQMVESIRDYRLLTFSTHAMSLQTLVDMDYWCTSVVNEDSRQYSRAWFRYHGKFRAIPLFLPVKMDAVHVGRLHNTVRNLYLQQQRWAYGIEHFPYIVLECLRHREIPWLDRAAFIWRTFNGAFSWSTQSFFITVVGWLPIALNPAFRDQVVASNFPEVTKILLSITWVGIVVSNVISLQMLPPRPKDKKGHPAFDFLLMIFQWVLVPITSVFFGAITGLDAQTHLMLGKYLGFRVTEKKAV